jgi:hypothetical protein
MNYNLYKSKLEKMCRNNQNAVFNDNKIIVYSIGDIHGDLKRLEHILLNIIGVFKLKNNKITWKKNTENIYIVQVGDITNGYRKDYTPPENYLSEDIDIIKLVIRLDEDAIENKKNCRFITLIGNHEIQNLGYIFSASFKHVPLKTEINKRTKQIDELHEKIICNFYPYVIINNYLFAHNGIIKKFVEYLKEFFNIDIKEIMMKIKDDQQKINVLNKVIKIITLYVNELANNIDEYNEDSIESNLFRNKFADLHTYFRISNYTSNKECYELFQILAVFDVEGMIIGHIPQSDNNIKIKCEGKLIKTDIFLSRLYGDLSAKLIQILKIENGEFEIIKEK